jgi:DNA-binding beta-propeller fold protein YncE
MRIASAVLLIVLAFSLSAATSYDVRPIALPGGSELGIAMDYLAYDATTHSLWVPAGNTGAVDVIDTKTGKIRQITGLPTKEVTNGERKRVVGPSSASVGHNAVYVGNRADSTVCAYDSRSLKRLRCGTLDAMPDGVVFVSSTNEVWATTPRDQSIRVLDANTLKQKTKIALDGAPEGYAVDAKHHTFFTNLEDKDETLAIDVQTRKTTSRWKSACGESGPRGLAVAPDRNLLFIACTDKVESFRLGAKPVLLSSADTGAGVDSFDFSQGARQLFVGAARAGRLTVIDVDGSGHLRMSAQVTTAPGARNGVIDADGTVYLAHSQGNELIAVSKKK